VVALSGEPFPKSRQLARGQKRRHRFMANEKQWQVLARTKGGPCRVCLTSASNGRVYSKIQLHHVVARSQGGDDYAANLVPVCPDCHRLLHNREPDTCRRLVESLTDAEYAYAVEKAGEAVWERVYGITYERAT
jgi:5-methylcytosine-specific restriction endonuclease McrA